MAKAECTKTINLKNDDDEKSRGNVYFDRNQVNQIHE